VWGDHQTADHVTCRVPLIIRWPGMSAQPCTDSALHYNFDWAATLLELLGRQVPQNWDGHSFAAALKNGAEQGREYLVVSQGAWACQRGVRFSHAGENFFCLRTYHDGYKAVEPVMLFNLTLDPHEQHDIAGERPELTDHALALLETWQRDMMATSTTNVDPMMTVMREGGPFHTRGTLPWYAARLRATGRGQHANRLERLHPQEKAPRP
jgi:arylsulfatase A-like enzyme